MRRRVKKGTKMFRRKSEVFQNGEVRLEIYTIRSTLSPQWWEFTKRYRWWRLQTQVRHDRSKLSYDTQKALYEAEKAIENELFYGRGAP